ncbi:hypothetical protein MM710_37820, partial [Klebsiella pneumoniae]|nr:hypothetical protein [Klebsiella pneumoniae]
KRVLGDFAGERQITLAHRAARREHPSNRPNFRGTRPQTNFAICRLKTVARTGGFLSIKEQQ